MQRFLFKGLVVVVLVAGGAASLAAQNFPPIPSYYSQLQFNLTSPSAYSTVVGGYANPAVYATLPGSEFNFSWNNRREAPLQPDRWGVFLGGRHLGLGVVRNELPLPPGADASVSDWRFALSLGKAAAALGIGIGWSTGDDNAVGRSSVFQIALVQRFGRHVSFGIDGDFALDTSYQKGLFDLAVRPLGNEKIILFGDYELPKGVSASDAPWSLGATVEPLAGLQLTGRYYENESWLVALGFAFGHRLEFDAAPRFDSDHHTNTIYEIRVGFPQPSAFDQWITKDKQYLAMSLKGNVTYRKFKYFDRNSKPLHRILSDLEKAIDDGTISGVALNLSGMNINRGMAWEIREKIIDVQAAGKKVVVFVDGLGMTELHMVSPADAIVFDPEGLVFLPGYVLSRTYIKETLDKIGIAFDEWRFLEYKSAAETFSRTSMSEADREQRYSLIESFYNTTRAEVSASLGVSPDKFDEWVNDEVILDAKEALDLGIIDDIGRWEDVRGVVTKLEGGNRKSYVSRRKLAGNYYPVRSWGGDPEIAVVYGIGLCAMDTGIRARKLEKIFLYLRNNSKVKAVVFRVDSPGGSGQASDVVAEAMRKCAEKKPVIVSQGNLAASGGYWISMEGTQIYALPGTVVGSIGVIGGWVWNDGLTEKLGNTSDFVAVGDHADLFAGTKIMLVGPTLPNRNMTAEERENVIDYMTVFYDGFVAKVAKARKMPVDDVEELAQGRVFSGVVAKENGLVDEVGSLDAAIAAARAAAGLDDDERVKYVEYPKLPPFNPRALRPFPGVIAGLFGWDDAPDAFDDEYAKNPEWTYLKTIIAHPGRPLVLLPPDLYIRTPSQMSW